MNHSRKLGTGRYLQKATVTGRGVFPLDMLRYDSCYPTSGTDVSSLHASITEPRGTFSVGLSRVSASAHEQWTTARWASFGWTLEEVQA